MLAIGILRLVLSGISFFVMLFQPVLLLAPMLIVTAACLLAGLGFVIHSRLHAQYTFEDDGEDN